MKIVNHWSRMRIAGAITLLIGSGCQSAVDLSSLSDVLIDESALDLPMLRYSPQSDTTRKHSNVSLNLSPAALPPGATYADSVAALQAHVDIFGGLKTSWQDDGLGRVWGKMEPLIFWSGNHLTATPTWSFKRIKANFSEVQQGSGGQTSKTITSVFTNLWRELAGGYYAKATLSWITPQADKPCGLVWTPVLNVEAHYSGIPLHGGGVLPHGHAFDDANATLTSLPCRPCPGGEAVRTDRPRNEGVNLAVGINTSTDLLPECYEDGSPAPDTSAVGGGGGGGGYTPGVGGGGTIAVETCTGFHVYAADGTYLYSFIVECHTTIYNMN